jgi:hypothetical protein
MCYSLNEDAWPKKQVTNELITAQLATVCSRAFFPEEEGVFF